MCRDLHMALAIVTSLLATAVMTTSRPSGLVKAER